MSHLIIKKKNEVYITIEAEPHVYHELSDYFTFDVPGAKFMPQYRNKYWDGKIRLYSPGNGEIYGGLTEHLIQWCKTMRYTMEYEENKYFGLPDESNDEITLSGIRTFMQGITKFEPRIYQIQGVYEALKYNRKLLLSPTASGKSLMVYGIARFHVAMKRRVLLIVPTTSLVEQMYKDFEEYGWNAKHHCHKVYGGESPMSKKDVVITTWQSVYKLPKSYFNDFGAVIGDEAHLFKAVSLTKNNDKTNRL